MGSDVYVEIIESKCVWALKIKWKVQFLWELIIRFFYNKY